MMSLFLILSFRYGVLDRERKAGIAVLCILNPSICHLYFTSLA